MNNAWRISLYVLIIFASASYSGAQTEPAPPLPSPPTVRETIPADAWAVLWIRNLGQLDSHLAALACEINLPLPAGGPLLFAKAFTGMFAGLDESGGAALALLPMDDNAPVGRSLVLFIPTTDFDALIGLMASDPASGEKPRTDGNASPDGGDIRRINFLGRESFAGVWGRFAVIAQTSDTVQRVRNSRTSPAPPLSDAATGIGADSDVALFVNLTAIFRSAIFTRLAKQYALNDREIDAGGGLTSLTVGGRIGPDGLFLSAGLAADPASSVGTYLATSTAVSAPLLQTLPDQPFIVALGAARDRERSQHQGRTVSRWLSTYLPEDHPGGRLLRAIAPDLQAIVADSRNIALSLSPTSTGHGLITLSVVISTERDAGELVRRLADVYRRVQQDVDPASRAADILKLISHRPKAERTGDTDVDVYVMQIDPDADPQAKQRIERVTGDGGLHLRLAAPDDRHVVMALGGGPDDLQRLVLCSQTSSGSLASREAITRMAPHVLNPRAFEMYVALDEYGAWLEKFLQALELPAPAFHFAPLDAPIAISAAPINKSQIQLSAFIPAGALSELTAAWLQPTPPAPPSEARP